jgi:hypothetical protein
VVLGRCDADPPGHDWLTITNLSGRQRAGSIEDLGQTAPAVGAEMEDNEHGGAEIDRQVTNNALERRNRLH